MVYESDPNMLPDSNFLPGDLRYLAIGNQCRLLDPRRTPMKIVDIDTSFGHFILEITAFEDKGTFWEMPMEDVSRFQFNRDGSEANPTDISLYRELIERFDRTIRIECSPSRNQETSEQLTALKAEVSSWLEEKSEFLQSNVTIDFASRDGIPELYREFNALMRSRNLAAMEQKFAEQYVSNPFSGELVKGHRIVLAEMGLVEYAGKIIRNPTIFDGEWSKQRRKKHILVRLAFLREIFQRLKIEQVMLYRGLSVASKLEPPRNNSFVSATFSLEVALSQFNAASDTQSGVLYRQNVPIDRLFMTHLETSQMNRQFKEAEAVLLFDCEDKLF